MAAQRVWQRGAWVQVVVVVSLEGASSKNTAFTGLGASSGAFTVDDAGGGAPRPPPRAPHHPRVAQTCRKPRWLRSVEK
eukprot:6076687-Prymnesium_polylepis.1